MTTAILGLAAYCHDSAAVLFRDGEIVAAAQEERFSRRKFDPAFPSRAARWCLAQAELRWDQLAAVALVRPPLPWQPERAGDLHRDLAGLAGTDPGAAPPLLLVARHRAHAASAFFASPFVEAAALCLDGADGETTTSAWLGEGNRLAPLWTIDAPHSLGLLYSAFTSLCGFEVGAGEYKLMGLAPYGEPRFTGPIRERLIRIEEDGRFRLDEGYFAPAAPASLAAQRLAALFGIPKRSPGAPILNEHMDLARSIQAVTEDVVLKLARGLHSLTGAENLCLAGGVALNCVANGRLLREGPFRDVWVQPAAGDAGSALGAALSVWHERVGSRRDRADRSGDLMLGCFLGPAFDDTATEAVLASTGAVWTRLPDDLLFARVADLLAGGAVVGWMQDRMEFGPRALGARSILADPRDPGMQSRLNRKIKFRESFRPFAPAVLAERLGGWFAHDRPSPYMLFTAPVAPAARIPLSDEEEATGLDRLGLARSRIPAVTHVDYSARIQTVHPDCNPRFRRLLEAFEKQTGCPVLVNTSFNVRDEPIVCTPLDAWRCFVATDMDYLCIGNLLLARPDQPSLRGDAANA